MYNSVNIPENPNLDNILETIQEIIADLSPEQLELAFRSAEQEYGNFLTRGKLGNRIQAILNDLTDDNLLERFQTFLHSEGKINPRSFKIRVLNKLGIVDDNNDFTDEELSFICQSVLFVLSGLEFQSQENPLETLLNNPEKSINEIIITWYDFIKLGADPAAIDSEGRTFLHRLLLSGLGYQDINRTFNLSKLSDEIRLPLVNAVNERGETVLQSLLNSKLRFSNIINYYSYQLIKLGADPAATDSEGRTWLQWILLSGWGYQNIKDVFRNLNKLPDEIRLPLVNAVNGRGETALQSLLNSELSFDLKSKFSNMLIESGADYTPEQLEQLEQRQIPSGIHQQGNRYTTYAVERKNITPQDDDGLIINDRYDRLFEL